MERDRPRSHSGPRWRCDRGRSRSYVQAKRGGGEGGASARECAVTRRAVSARGLSDGVGRLKATEEIRSSFVAGLRISLARSDFLPSATKWHRLQGCWPLKVFSMAASRASVREKLMVMLTQAIDCNRAQWPPTTQTSASTIADLLSRFNTVGIVPKWRASRQRKKGTRIWR
jgi:hypothetical protein